MDLEQEYTVERVGPSQTWEGNSSEDDECEHQYDDYEDLFSNETLSSAADADDDNIGMYLETDPELQKQVAQLITLQRHLDALQEKLTEKKFAVLKSREELLACRTRSKALEEELIEVENEVQYAQDNDNKASIHRLLAKEGKLKIEIENEMKIEVEVQKNLQEAELRLSEVEMEQRHYYDLAEQVMEKEEIVNRRKKKMARYRLEKHHRAEKMMLKKFQNAERTLEDKVIERRVNQERAVEDAIVNHEKAKYFLNQSLARIREQEEVNELSEQHQIERKVKSIINLKNSIAQTRENLKALQARDTANEKKKEMAEKLEYDQVLREGGNPELVLLQRKKLAQLEQKKREFEAKQKLNKARIVSNILKEEESMKKKKKQQPHLFSDKQRTHGKSIKPLPKTPVQSKIDLTEDYEPVFLEQEKWLKELHRGDAVESSYRKPSLYKDSEDILLEPLNNRTSKATDATGPKEEAILTKPEFEGLWDQKDKNYKQRSTDHVVQKPIGGTKMEREILEKVLTKQREGIVTKQVAAGREFKGQPFYSKPDIIHFKDLDVGKSYKKKIVITNVSYSINFLHLTGMSEHLKDFIKIEFSPPGQMSAGMSCDMYVIFKPMIDEDLVGEVFFMAQTGPFSIPLKCTTKKCDLSVDVQSIDFGSQVVGETLRKSIILINKGALGTRFEFMKVPDKGGSPYTMETTLGRLTTAESMGVTPNDISEPLKTATTVQVGTAKKSKRTGGLSLPQTADMSSSRETSRPPPVKEVYHREDEEEKLDIEEEQFTQAGGDEIVFETPASDFNENIPDELKVGEVMSGEIDAFSSVRLDVVFAPCIPGDIQANFRVTFADIESKPIEIKVTAVAIDVPVWLERQNVDLKICMYDRLYQEQIIVHNRSSTALRLNFEVPKELQDHLELLPKTGYIQAKSKFPAQLKFLPRLSLAEDAAGLFDPETGVLECPLVIRVAEQTRPVPFVVNAIVTPSDLQFDQTEVDFGCCSIHESVIYTVKLTNHSILPQLFGFVGLPDYVDVQPNDGFGRILPLETIELDLIMNAKRAREYDFTLVCRSGINRDFLIHCRAVGVQPPLELSHQVINFSATALDDVSTALMYVVNSHTSANEFTHPVPRIGKGEIVPVGPTSFEFVIPDDAPISIFPLVGTITPGEHCQISVDFSPKLDDEAVRKEACNVAVQQREQRMREEEERIKREAEEAEAKRLEEEKAAAAASKGKKTPKTPAKPKTSEPAPRSRKTSPKLTEKQEENNIPLTPDMVNKNSMEYKAAHAYLTRTFEGDFQSYTIPCFVAPGKCSGNMDSVLPYDEANVLYLELRCPVVKPPVVIISNHGHSVADFGQVSIGQSDIKPISIQNISDQPVELSVSVLDTSGPFQMLNALRTLRPDETHTILSQFTPTQGKVFQEVLKIKGPSSSLDIHLVGRGVTPDIKIEPADGKLNMGHLLIGDVTTATFTLENKSSLAVKYSIQMDSTSLLRHDLQQQLPDFIRRNNQTAMTLVGTQNLNGRCVFDCVPCEGEIKTNEKHEIHVTFSPDHESSFFSDGARVILFDTEKSHVVHLTGSAHAHMMFIEGHDPLGVGVESLAMDARYLRVPDAPPPVKNLVLSLRSRVGEEGFATVTKNLGIGCVKTRAASAKRSFEWIVENFHEAQHKGFHIEPHRGTAEFDSTKPLTFSWTPSEGHDPSKPISTSVTVILKGDVTTTYNIMLSGLVSFH